MQPWPFNTCQRANFSLGALLLVSCLMILVSGPFHAALVFLRADGILAQSKTFQYYQGFATHAVRQQRQQGSGELSFEEQPLEYIWETAALGDAQIHHIQMTPAESLGWPAVTSLWFEGQGWHFEVRGSQPSP